MLCVLVSCAGIQICEGMQVIADEKLVHRDLALRNILVFGFSEQDPAQVNVKISDFGLTRDAQRAGQSTAYIHQPGNALPVRWMAPESLRLRRWTEKSDMWAMGVLLWEMWSHANFIPYHDIIEDNEVLRYVIGGGRLRQPTDCPDRIFQMIQICWVIEADRPTFRQLSHRLMDTLLGFRMEEFHGPTRPDQPGNDIEMHSCIMCLEERPLFPGVICSQGVRAEAHFVCNCEDTHCLQETVRQWVNSVPGSLKLLARNDGNMPCPVPGCNAHLRARDIAACLSVEGHAQYMAALRNGLELQLQEQIQESYERRLRDNLRRLAQHDVDAATEYVVQHILTPRCTRCTQPFVDFQGCFALNCSHCGAGLCAWCLKDCGEDAHRHVMNDCDSCLHKDSPLFPPEGMFEQARNIHCLREVRAFVGSFPRPRRNELQRKLQPHMQRLGIQPRRDGWMMGGE